MTGIVDLELRHLHRALAAAGDTPMVYTASAGTTRTAISSALTESEGAWIGALVRWDSGENAGLWSSVADFSAAADELTFDDDLPVAVTAGDTFTLFLGGKYLSTERIAGLRSSPLVNVTGLSIRFAGPGNDEGTGVLSFDASAGSVTWQPPFGVEGAAVSVAALALAERVVVEGGADSGLGMSRFIELERTAAALPFDDAADDVSLDLIPVSFLARVTGAQADAGTTIYRPIGLVNVGTATLLAIAAYAARPFPSFAGATLGAGLGTGPATLEADELSGFGTHGWIYNATKGDVRYVVDRSGNTATVIDPAGGQRGFTAVAWDEGDELLALPWFDLGVEAPGVGDALADPATQFDSPLGVAFTCPASVDDALEIGDLAPGEVYAVWLRFEIPAGFRPLEGGRVDLRFPLQVPA